MVLVSKNKLANETAISSNKNHVKNCFRIEGGDDVITGMVRAVNMNGSNYIYQFADFQYHDMSAELQKKIKTYQEMMSSKETQDAYYGNGDTDSFLDGTLACKVQSETAAVSSMEHYDNHLFTGVTNNIQAYAQVFLDSRFDLEIVSGTASYSYTKGAAAGTWKGKIRITQHTDEGNVYPLDESL